MPVSILDGKPVGKGKPGPVYQKIIQSIGRVKSQNTLKKLITKRIQAFGLIKLMVKKNFMAPLLFLLGSIFLISPSVLALEPFKVKYNIYKGPLKVGAISRNLRIKHDGQYTFTSRMESKGFAKFLSGSLLLETSKGEIIEDKIIPHTYLRKLTNRIKL